MDKNKKERLEAKGWKIGNAEDFLGLSKEETEFIELKIALSRKLAAERKHRKMTQAQLAKKMKTSQSRISKMEKGDASVTLDLLFRSLIALGLSPKNLLSETINP